MTIRRLTLAALAAALTSLAFAASAHALAPTVEVSNEDTEQPCPSITSPSPIAGDDIGETSPAGPVTGGCVVRATGEVKLGGHIFGFEGTRSDCEVDLEAHLDDDAEGWVDAASLTHHAGMSDCTVQACDADGGGMQLWPLHVEEVAANDLELRVEICFEDVGGGNEGECEAAMAVSTGGGGSHDYELVFTDLAATNHLSAPFCEVDGELHFDDDGACVDHDEIELTHV